MPLGALRREPRRCPARPRQTARDSRVGAAQSAGDVALYTEAALVYTQPVTKRLIDVDDVALDAARAELGTRTIKDTVNEALRRAAAARQSKLDQALDVLANADLNDRSTAWR